MKNKLCLIQQKNDNFKYEIFTKMLDSPKKYIENNNLYILNFIKNEFVFNKNDLKKYKIN